MKKKPSKVILPGNKLQIFPFILIFLIIVISFLIYYSKRKVITLTNQTISSQISKSPTTPNSSEIIEQIFTIDDFSDDYYGKMKVENPKEVFSKGWIAIYEKKTNKEIIKVDSDELAFSLHDGKIQSNILQLPYGEQSNIIYKDFNFDGINDFAIMDGQKSCYHGPSFKIYLASNGTYVYDVNFTRLAQEYCGMFSVDYGKKEINTMTKSGCCWHEYSTFQVINNIPQLIYKMIDDANESRDNPKPDKKRIITEEKLINNKWVKTITEEPLKE